MYFILNVAHLKTLFSVNYNLSYKELQEAYDQRLTKIFGLVGSVILFRVHHTITNASL